MLTGVENYRYEEMLNTLGLFSLEEMTKTEFKCLNL